MWAEELCRACDAFYLLKPTISFKAEEKADVKDAFTLWVLPGLAVAWARGARSLLQTDHLLMLQKGCTWRSLSLTLWS